MATSKAKQGKPPYLTRSHLQSKTSPGRAPPIRDVWSEAHCKECHRRITIGPDGDEYGHARGIKADSECCSHHCYGGAIPDA